MSWFNVSEPLLRFKQKELDVQDLCGLLRIQWRVGQMTLWAAAYTRIDQVFILWGLVTAAIFTIAQFCPISWQLQAIAWSVLTVIATVGMAYLAHFWVRVERLCWVVYWWAGLMLTGLLITNLGIFGGVAPILIHLCPLWLGLTAVGYAGMGVGMRSRTFLACGLLHLVGMRLLPYVVGWQFLATGIIMAGSLLLLAELQWDMRPPITAAVLSSEELAFNHQQHLLRQSQKAL